MTTEQFNKKYEQYLEKGFYGLEIEVPEVIEYLDKQFEEEIKINPDFQYAQVKMKFNWARVYAESDMTGEWEKVITEIMNTPV